MIDNIYNVAKQFLAENDLASGGLVIAITTSILVYLRDFPRSVWQLLMRRTFVTIEILDTDMLYVWVAEWAKDNMRARYTRRYNAVTDVQAIGRSTLRADRKNAANTPPNASHPAPAEPQTLQFLPAPGQHLMWFDRWPIVVSRSREAGSDQNNIYDKETITLKVPWFKLDKVKRFLEEMRQAKTVPPEVAVRLFRYGYCGWSTVSDLPVRSTKSVILPGGEMDKITADIDRFLASKNRYADLGIPYRRGYLLEGVPGSGKTSLVHALASKYQMDLCVLSLNSVDDSDISDALAGRNDKSIVVVEDIDCLFQMRERTDDNQSKLTFFGLLNAIDGIISSQGRLLFVTTNHAELLDEALTRPGRIDYRMRFGCATAEQARELFARFSETDDGAEPFVRWATSQDRPMAELQNKLIATEYADGSAERAADRALESCGAASAGSRLG